MRRAILVLAMLTIPAGAMAQEVSHSFADLIRKGTLKEGDRILITSDLTGNGEYEELKTELLGLTDSGISIKVDSLPAGRMENVVPTGGGFQVEIPQDRVQRIEQKHGPSGTLGVVLGAAAGGTAGVLIGIEATKNDDSGPLGALVGGLVGGVGGGLALGLVFRSMSSEEVHYTSVGPRQGSFDVSLAPIISRRKKGALLTVTW